MSQAELESMRSAARGGDHHRARTLARAILQRETENDMAHEARDVLRATEPDAFLSLIGLVGLGLTAWLVYNYVL